MFSSCGTAQPQAAQSPAYGRCATSAAIVAGCGSRKGQGLIQLSTGLGSHH